MPRSYLQGSQSLVSLSIFRARTSSISNICSTVDFYPIVDLSSSFDIRFIVDLHSIVDFSSSLVFRSIVDFSRVIDFLTYNANLAVAM